MTCVHLKVCISVLFLKDSNQEIKPTPLFLSVYTTSKKASCTTVSSTIEPLKGVSGEEANKNCIFPFIYEGLTFNTCTLYTYAWLFAYL